MASKTFWCTRRESISWCKFSPTGLETLVGTLELNEHYNSKENVFAWLVLKHGVTPSMVVKGTPVVVPY